jgi:hypothetical protein
MSTRVTCVFTVVVAFFFGLGVPMERSGAVEAWSYGGTFDLAIPADPGATSGWMDEAIVEVPDHLIIQDLNVSLSVTHTNAFDLQLFLTSPSGTTLQLSSFDPLDGFFTGEDYRQTVFDDEAAVSIVDGAPPFDGAYRPLASEGLAVFDGEDAFGYWRLEIFDAYYLDTGTLDAFVLTFAAPEPATAIVLLSGLGVVRLWGRRRP